MKKSAIDKKLINCRLFCVARYVNPARDIFPCRIYRPAAVIKAYLLCYLLCRILNLFCPFLLLKAHPLIIVRIILKRVFALTAWRWLAGMISTSPALG